LIQATGQVPGIIQIDVAGKVSGLGGGSAPTEIKEPGTGSIAGGSIYKLRPHNGNDVAFLGSNGASAFVGSLTLAGGNESFLKLAGVAPTMAVFEEGPAQTNLYMGATRPTDASSTGYSPFVIRFNVQNSNGAIAVDPGYNPFGLGTVDGIPNNGFVSPDGQLNVLLKLSSPKKALPTTFDHGFIRLLGDAITGTVTEFYNTNLNHFFVTANPQEANAIDGGSAGPGWSRTGLSFKSGGRNRVCRFYGTPGVGPNSHFYTADPAECGQVKSDPGWHYESYDFSTTPPAAGGVCDMGLVPVYRAYNNRFAFNDSNHRLTTSLAAYNAQVAAGWKGEGTVMCAPQ
jgi:hypothetical protein